MSMLYMAGKWRAITGLIILSIAMLPINTSAYDSNGIQASEAQVALSPSTGLTQGDSLTVYLTLTIHYNPMPLMLNMHFSRMIIPHRSNY